MDDLKSFILENKFKIIICKNNINIINYDDIKIIDDTKIIVSSENKSIKISGKKLVLKCLLNDEILITGIIESIEFR